MTVVFLTSSMAVCDLSDGDYDYDDYLAQASDIAVSPSRSSVMMKAGDTTTIFLDVQNTLERTLVVYVECAVEFDDLAVTFPKDDGRLVVEGKEVEGCPVTLTASKFSNTYNHSLKFKITLNDPKRGSSIEAESNDIINVYIDPLTYGDNYYNKFFGLLDNNFDGPLGHSWFPALVTIMLFSSLAYLVGFVIYPYIESKREARRK